MPEPRKNPDELGALWEKTNDRGTYMTGTIGGQKVVCFRNDRKTTETQPDWRVLKSKPRDESKSFNKPVWGRNRRQEEVDAHPQAHWPDRPNDEDIDGID
jgi:hypothetical protein